MEALEGRLLMSAVDLTLAGAPVDGANGAIFARTGNQPVGTGNIDSFVRFRATDTEAGYNTSGEREFATKNDGWCRALQLSEISTINIGGRNYRQFMLDVNQTGASPLLTMESLQIWVGTQGDYSDYASWDQTDPTAAPAKVFDMDIGPDGDSSVLIDYSLESGSGTGDMIVYIPESAFAGRAASDYVYLYSAFGRPEYPSNDGFEEWYVGTGITPTGEIHGYKFNDLNGNGADDADPKLAGWTFYIDANNNGQLDPDEATSGPTGDDGEFHFTNLAAGMGEYSIYRIREVQQDGWVQTAGGADIGIESIQVGQKASDQVGQVYIALDGLAGYLADPPLVNVDAGLAFGNFQLITISGTKFKDLTGNGLDGADTGLGGWTIDLYKDDGDGAFDPLADQPVDQKVTDGNGDYRFEDVGPGLYFVVEEIPVATPAWVQTYPGVIGQDPFHTVTAASGQNVEDQDFANYQRPDTETGIVDIFGMKFEDKNVDGVYEPGPDLVADDQPLANWTIFLDMNGDKQLDWTDGNGNAAWDDGEGEQWTLTGADGMYSFLGLPGEDNDHNPIVYHVCELLPTITAAVVTQHVSHNVKGDFNSDGIVDLQDFGLMKRGFGMKGAKWADGDANGDAAVTLEDFGSFKDNYGLSKSDVPSASLVPVVTYEVQNAWIPTTPGAPGPIDCAGLPGQSVTFMPWTGFVNVDPDKPMVIVDDKIGLAFGNARVVPGDGRTLGFWSNKNGQGIIRGSYDPVLGIYTDLELLANLNLQGPGTTPFNPDPTVLDSSLRLWLLDGNAVDMHYMLSVQLAAMALNEAHGFVQGTDRMMVSTLVDPTGIITVDELIEKANLALIDGTAAREYLEALKTALDDGNNNRNWL